MADPTNPSTFDVFLSHNSKDKPAVIALAQRLQAHGIKVWLDAWELRPGHPWQEALEEIISSSRSAAVLVGMEGIGPWEDTEMRSCLDEFVHRKMPVIPLLLPGCPKTPELPLLLRRFTWVDCRDGKEEEGFYRLIWGITGSKPKQLGDFINPGISVEPQPQPEPVPVVPYIHGWPSDKVQALQIQAANALGKPVVFRDRLSLGSEGPEMVVIPAGSFIMGSPANEPERNENEGPQHFVTHSRPFAMGKYAVTFEEYDLFCLRTQRDPVSDAGWGRGRRPVIQVTWYEALAYSEWLSAQTGQTYRLPTEAEWEYACRAGTTTPFHFGETISTDLANYEGNGTYGKGKKGIYRRRTVEVGQFPTNVWGLHDMHGNVWEWTASEFEQVFAGEELRVSNANTKESISVRGGSWDFNPRLLRCSNRSRKDPDLITTHGGFRLARTFPL